MNVALPFYCISYNYLLSALFNHILHLQLEYDILQYIVIERLAQGGRAKLKDDGLNLRLASMSCILLGAPVCTF